MYGGYLGALRAAQQQGNGGQVPVPPPAPNTPPPQPPTVNENSGSGSSSGKGGHPKGERKITDAELPDWVDRFNWAYDHATPEKQIEMENSEANRHLAERAEALGLRPHI